MFWLLEELGQPYEIELVDIRAPGGVPESYREIQPNKKVPAVVHDGTVVTERAAICLYLADAFPGAGLAPAIGDKARAPYITWLVYCNSVFDPAVAARANGWEYQSNNFSFGLFDDMVANVEKRLLRQPYAVGDRFTAADTQLAAGINFTMNILKVLPQAARLPRLCRPRDGSACLPALCRQGYGACPEGDAAAIRGQGG